MSRLSASPRRRTIAMVAVALVPVILLAVGSIALASEQVTSVVEKQVRTTAAVSSVVVGQETDNLVSLVRSYATRPSLIAGMEYRNGENAQVEAALSSLAHAVPGISAAFVADPAGNSRNTYPYFPAVIGTNFAYREWFTGLAASGHPYVSSAIQTHETSRTLAVTITDYIRAADGHVIGILGVNYSLNSIAAFANHVGDAQGITLRVTDRRGTSLTAGGVHGLVSLASDPRVRAALAGHTGLMNYTPVNAGGGRGAKELSAYAPVQGTGWTVVASVPRSAAFAGLVHLREAVLAITAVLVLILLAAVRMIMRSDNRRRAFEEQVQERDRELATVKSLGVMAGGVAHNFNNLLLAILGNAGLALRELPPDSPAHSSIEQIELAGGRAAELARDMLAYSGMGTVTVGPVDLAALAGEMGQLVTAGGAATVHVDYRFADGLPPIVADVAQIRQVLSSIITNSAEALGAAGGSILVRGDLVDDMDVDGFRLTDGPLAGPCVRLEVEDTGVGMDEHTLEHIFDPFFTTKFTGRGLGLAAVLGIVRGHGGAIRVTSRPGLGTVTTLLFPVAPLPAAAAAV